LIWDSLLIAAAGIVSIGLAMIYPPAGLIFAGLAVGAFACFGAWNEARKTAPPDESVESQSPAAGD
jgi:hypothetical protein